MPPEKQHGKLKDGRTYVVFASQLADNGRWSVAVEIEGLPRKEDDDSTYSSLDAAFEGGHKLADEIA